MDAMTSSRRVMIALLVAVLALPSTARASGGTIDTSFSGDGLSSLADFGRSDTPNATAIDRAGRIIVAGTAYTGLAVGNTRLAVARFRADGRLDTTFSGDGRVTAAIGTTAVPAAIAVGPDASVV